MKKSQIITARRKLRASHRAQKYNLPTEESLHIEKILCRWIGINWTPRKKNPWRVQIKASFDADGNIIKDGRYNPGYRKAGDRSRTAARKIIFDECFHTAVVAAHVYNLFVAQYGWHEIVDGKKVLPNDLSEFRILKDSDHPLCRTCQEVLLDNGDSSAFVDYGEKSKETQLYSWFTNSEGHPVRYWLEGNKLVEQRLDEYLTGEKQPRDNFDKLDCRRLNMDAWYD
jgi:hypothetical protein